MVREIDADGNGEVDFDGEHAHEFPPAAATPSAVPSERLPSRRR